MQTYNITKLLDLPDLIATDLLVLDDVYIFIAEAKKKKWKCSNCGFITDKVHDRRWQNIKDVPIREKQVIIRLEKKRYRCDKCDNNPFNEKYESINKYSRKTKRLDSYIVNSAQKIDYTSIAEKLEVSYTSISNSVENKAKSLIEDINLDEIEYLSIDEFSIRKKHEYAVALSDPKEQELIAILPSRKKDDLIDYFEQEWPEEVRKNIKAISMDMWNAYNSMAQQVFPNAKIVVDKFHIVMKVGDALDNVRKKIKKEANDENSTKFYKSRNLLRKNGEELTDEEHDKLIELFKLSPNLEKAWELKEEFRDVLQMNKVSEAKSALNDWYECVIDSGLKSFLEAKKTVENWEDKLLNFFETKISNGFAEGINNKIKLIKRIGYGVTNLKNLKHRLFVAFM
jgi:transposase